MAQGDTKHLATLVEDGLHDTTEELFVAAEIGHIISRHADNSRLHLGWRVEDRGFNGEKVLDIVPRLDEDREDARGLRARLSSHAQGHLTLNHARTAGDEVAVVEHFEEDLRRDVVGIVASKDKLATSKKFAKIHAKEVTGDKPYPRPLLRREWGIRSPLWGRSHTGGSSKDPSRPSREGRSPTLGPSPAGRGGN